MLMNGLHYHTYKFSGWMLVWYLPGIVYYCTYSYVCSNYVEVRTMHLASLHTVWFGVLVCAIAN